MLSHIVHKIEVLEKDGEIPRLLLLLRQPLAEQLINAVVHGVMAALVMNDCVAPRGQFGILHPKFVFRHGLRHAARNVKLERVLWRLVGIRIRDAIGFTVLDGRQTRGFAPRDELGRTVQYFFG